MKKIPNDLKAWLDACKADTSKQQFIIPPEDMAGGLVALEGPDDAPAWIGAPFTRAEHATINKLSPKTGKLETVPHDYFEDSLTFNTEAGPVTFQAVGFDPPCGCAVYVRADVYEDYSGPLARFK